MADPRISSLQRIKGKLHILQLPKIKPITASETLIEVLERIWTMKTAGLPRSMVTDLADIGQKAMQHTAHCLQEAFGGQTPDLKTLGWEAPVLRRERKDDPLRLRMAIIARDMDEVCLVNDLEQYTATSILDAASEILLGCSGMAMTSEYSNGMIIDMPAVVTTTVPKVKGSMFECAALVLCQLARYHYRWYSSNDSLSIMLWGQTVPRTGVRPRQHFSLRSPESAVTRHKARDTGKRFATNQAQELHWDLLKSKTEGMLFLGMPPDLYTFIETHIARALEVIDEACRCRYDSSLGWICSDYNDQMHEFAQQALTFLALRINKFFPVTKVEDSFAEPYQRNSSLRPRPLTKTPSVLRHWAVLFALDMLYRVDTKDLRYTAQNFQDALVYASGQEASAGVLRAKGSDVEDFVEPVEIGAFENMVFGSVENDKMDEAWRADMRRYARYAMVGLAQCVSSIFGGASMTLWGKTVPQRAEDRMMKHRGPLTDSEIVV